MESPKFQLALPIHQIESETLANFYTGDNQVLLSSLDTNYKSLEQPFFFIWGLKSSGKTHLLTALVNESLNREQTAVYIPLSQSSHFSPEVLENLEFQKLVCLDDLQTVVGNRKWELAIFDLFNRIREYGQSMLVISADKPLSQLDIHLPDLVSRLTWGETYQIKELDEKDKALVLQYQAKNRGLEMPPEVINFLLKRINRDMASLLKALNILDKAALRVQRRKLSLPFVKEVLAI